MSNFKVHDRVVFTEVYGNYFPGDAGTVANIERGILPGQFMLRVRMDNTGHSVSAFDRRFKLESNSKFNVGDKVVYNGTGTLLGIWGDRYRNQVSGTITKVRVSDLSVRGYQRYNVDFTDNYIRSVVPENHLTRVQPNPFASTLPKQENTVTSNLIGPKPAPTKGPLVELPLRTAQDYIRDANHGDVLKVLAGVDRGARSELATELLRLINLGLEADKSVAAPKFRLRKSGTWFEVEPGHFVHTYGTRSDAVRDWESHGKSRTYGNLLSKSWEDRHPLTEDQDAPGYVLREALDVDRDKWFEVKPGVWAMADTREQAELKRDTRKVHGFAFSPLKVNGETIPEHTNA